MEENRQEAASKVAEIVRKKYRVEGTKSSAIVMLVVLAEYIEYLEANQKTLSLWVRFKKAWGRLKSTLLQ